MRDPGRGAGQHIPTAARAAAIEGIRVRILNPRWNEYKISPLENEIWHATAIRVFSMMDMLNESIKRLIRQEGT